MYFTNELIHDLTDYCYPQGQSTDFGDVEVKVVKSLHPELIRTPFIDSRQFDLNNFNISKHVLSIKSDLTNFCVSKVYSRRK